MAARDLSVIATPPPNRYPIESEVVRFNESLIRDAVQYELQRGGQIYFIHNRVENIQEIAGMLQRLIPDARIAFISLSSDSLPKVIRVASKTAIGTESAKIQARFKNKYSSMINKSSPLPKNLSIALSKKFTNRMKVIINRE